MLSAVVVCIQQGKNVLGPRHVQSRRLCREAWRVPALPICAAGGYGSYGMYSPDGPLTWPRKDACPQEFVCRFSFSGFNSSTSRTVQATPTVTLEVGNLSWKFLSRKLAELGFSLVLPVISSLQGLEGKGFKRDSSTGNLWIWGRGDEHVILSQES